MPDWIVDGQTPLSPAMTPDEMLKTAPAGGAGAALMSGVGRITEGLGQSLEASLYEPTSLWGHIGRGIIAGGEAEGGVPPEQSIFGAQTPYSGAPLPTTGEMVSPTQVKKEGGPDIGAEPISRELANVLIASHKENEEKAGIYERWASTPSWGGAVGQGVRNFAVSAVSSMMDPLAAATLFVPGIGEAGMMGALTRAGVGALPARLLAGAGSQALGVTTATVPLIAAEYGISREEREEFDLRDQFAQLAYGAGFGALLGAGIAALPRRGAAAIGRAAETPEPGAEAPAPPEAAAPVAPIPVVEPTDYGRPPPDWLTPEARADVEDIANADLVTQHALTSTSVAQILNEEPINVEPILAASRLQRPEPIRGLDFLPPEAQPVSLGGDWFRERLDAMGGDQGAVADLLTNRVGWALDRGLPVTLYADGKAVPITSVDRGMMADAEGLRWGTMAIATDNTGTNRVEIGTVRRPTPSPAEIVEQQERLHREGVASGMPQSEMVAANDALREFEQVSPKPETTPNGELVAPAEPPPPDWLSPAEAEPAPSAGVPLMITQEMRTQLAERGFDADQIRGMTPAQAHEALAVPTSRLEATPEPAPTTATQPFQTLPKKPQRLASFLKAEGGVRDQSGEISHILGGTRFRPGLVNGRGMTLDDAALKAWEAGYFPEITERPTINDLLDKLGEDLRGLPRYSLHDEDAANAFHEAMGANSEVDRLSSQLGIDTKGKTRAQFMDEAAEHLSLEDAARQRDEADGAIEKEFAEAEARGQEWAAARGEAWEPDYHIGQPRILEEVEDAYRQEAAAREARAGTGGVGGAVQVGPGQGGVRPGPGLGNLPEAGAAEAGRPSLTTERTAQGEQIVLPGAERTATQAAAAREAAGHGRIAPPTTQEAPGGLFAEPEAKQVSLFADPEIAAAEQQFAQLTAGRSLLPEERALLDETAAGLTKADLMEEGYKAAAQCIIDAGG